MINLVKKNKNIVFLIILSISAWSLNKSFETKESILIDEKDKIENKFYLKFSKIISTDKSGIHLFTMDAEYAEQESNNIINFYDVKISYSPQSKISWIITSDKAIKIDNEDFFLLEGNVKASTLKESSHETTVLTEQLEVDPQRYLIKTEKMVTINIDNNNLSAEGMMAILNEDRLELKSKIKGKFLKKNIQ